MQIMLVILILVFVSIILMQLWINRFWIISNNMQTFYKCLKKGKYKKLIVKRQKYYSGYKGMSGSYKELPMYGDDEKIGTREMIDSQLYVYNIKDNNIYKILNVEYTVENRNKIIKIVDEYNLIKELGSYDEIKPI